MNDNNYDDFNIQCNHCGERYGISNNNIHGFYNCCKDCGKLEYENYINKQIEKKLQEIIELQKTLRDVKNDSDLDRDMVSLYPN